jgi:cation diffusion facilitator family transporter
MADCCSNAACEVERLRERQGSTLRWVLGINLGMFGVELTAGILAASTALLADSLDMLGDALVYGFSLYAVGRSATWKARAALFKGGIMAAFGLFVLVQAVHRALIPELPHAGTMGAIGLLALAANALCLGLLWRHRADDINMRSVWLCSRNDIIANVSVLAAAGAVVLTASRWPDILVGLGIAALFLRTAWGVLRDARAELRGPQGPGPAGAVSVSLPAPPRQSRRA